MSAGLVVFDVDGTLCDTFAVDDECFCAVASAMLRVPLGPSSWEGSPHVTDSGIVEWLWRGHLGRPPSPRELEVFVEEFEGALATELRRAPHRFRARAGATRVLDRVAAAGWDMAVATGGWGRTARLKLAAAGLPEALLLASSDDSHDRVEIFELARTRAGAARGRRYPRTVLVGDGIWDLRVAAHLGWPLIGVARGERAARLRESGATAVVEDFTDVDGFLALLHQCAVPQATGGGAATREGDG